MWDNHHDAQMRCSGTIIRYKGRAVTIREVTGDMNLAIRYLDTQRDIMVRIKDKDLDWSPVPLGNVNIRGRVVYVGRKAVRKWKHGLHRDNAYLKVEEGLVDSGVLYTPEMAKMVKRDYPKLKKCLESVRAGEATARAFSPNFSVRKDDIGLVWLQFRCDKVGWFTGDELTWGDGSDYLKEMYAMEAV